MSIKPDDLARLCEALGIKPDYYCRYCQVWQTKSKECKDCGTPTSGVRYPPLDNDLAVEMMESDKALGTWWGGSCSGGFEMEFIPFLGEKTYPGDGDTFPEAVAAALLAALDAGAFENGGDG